jgi:hypothetical protein
MEKVGQAGRRVEQFGCVLNQSWIMGNDFEQRYIPTSSYMIHSVSKLKQQTAEILKEWSNVAFIDYPDAKKQLIDLETFKTSTKREWTIEKRNLESVLLLDVSDT